MITVGRQNESTRVAWGEKMLKKIPADARILDAGAGEQRFKKNCAHLNYVSQDFGKYEGLGDGAGLQTGKWEYDKLDIVSDIANIPQPEGSFDAILCTEVFEHLPDPLAALREFSRLLKNGGYLILTAPFCSITHFSPHHYYSGFNRYFYQCHLPKNDFKILEITPNGNFFEYIAQEVIRINDVAKQHAHYHLNLFEKGILFLSLKMLERYSRRDQGSNGLVCFGYHVFAQRI